MFIFNNKIADNELYQIAVLIDDLKSEDVQSRLKSMKRLKDICKYY